MDQATRLFAPDTGIQEINLSIDAGTIIGLIGPSGCGKTTTVRLLTGIDRPDSGNVWVLQRAPHQFSRRQRKQIGYVPQRFALYKRLSVRENLDFAASLQGLPIFGRGKNLDKMIDFVELADARHRPAGQLSGGMQRRLMLASALLHTPRIIFADEPTAGIDPVLREKIWQGFRGLRDEGRTMVVTTQYVGEASYCDYVAVMGMGRMLAIDTPENLRRQALGGDLLRIDVPTEQIATAAAALQHHQALRRIDVRHEEPDTIYLTVADAGEQLPQALDVLRQEAQIQVHSAQQQVPPFDEVFVRLMTRQGENHA